MWEAVRCDGEGLFRLAAEARRGGDFVVRDVLAEGLQLIFVGYNPGRSSEESGHHFAGPQNLFWPLLYEAGLTPRRLRAEEDREVLLYGIGITNLVERMTPSSADLTAEEKTAGARRLREKLSQLRPAVVCLLGKDIYRAYAGLAASRPVVWGLQDPVLIPGVRDCVAPNPSRRSTVPYGLRLALMQRLAGSLAYDR
jgi:mismatch-specific thymine-DNA glycosylase